MNRNSDLKIASLFSGCGGSDLGSKGGFTYNGKYYHRHPVETVFATDIDRKALNTYQLNFPKDEVLCADITELNSVNIPDHDILIGGFPCQSFSTVNPTKDPFDERARLYMQMVRILKEKKPKAFIAENVKGFMILYKGSIFKKVCEEFNKAGYTIYHRLLNASDYGIPQKRERVFIVGIRNDIDSDFRFPEPTSPEKKIPLSVAVPELAIENKKYYFSEKAVQGMKNAKNNMKRGLWQDLSEPCLTITSHLAKVSINSRDPVLLVDPDKELYRRFTPREAARIQSFPDSFQFAGSEGDAYRQIGNAIPPVLFWHLTESLIKSLNSQKNEPSIIHRYSQAHCEDNRLS